MQLKRDTDYALQIVFCLKQDHEENDSGTARGLTLTEISIRTGVPRLTAGRICERLRARGVIDLCSDQGYMEKSYCASEKLPACTLLDIVEAIEGTGKIFAVFNRRSLMYRAAENEIMKAQKQVEWALNEITVDSLF